MTVTTLIDQCICNHSGKLDCQSVTACSFCWFGLFGCEFHVLVLCIHSALYLFNYSICHAYFCSLISILPTEIHIVRKIEFARIQSVIFSKHSNSIYDIVLDVRFLYVRFKCILIMHAAIFWVLVLCNHIATCTRSVACLEFISE